MNDYTNIIEIILGILSAIITAFVIPVLNKKLSAEKRQNLLFWVQTAVAAAEQYFGSKTGQEKKDYVVNFLLSKGIVFDVDEVNTMIESEVYKLSAGQVKGNGVTDKAVQEQNLAATTITKSASF